MKLIVPSLFSLFLLTGPATAQVVFVDASAAPGGDGSSWGSAHIDLQDALADAASDPTIEQIWIAAGTYLPGSSRTASFDAVERVSWYGGFAGGETSLDQRDPDANPTVLSGDLLGNDVVTDVDGDGVYEQANYDDNSLHVVRVDLSGPGIVLDGLRIESGSADGSSAPETRGGGVQHLAGALTLIDVDFADNRSTGPLNGGAAVYASSDDGLTAIGCTFERNNALRGGGILGDEETTTVEDCVFRNNYATSGAGIFVRFSTGVVRGSLFDDNDATSGAGINSHGSDLTVESSTFTRNHATAGAGVAFIQGHLGPVSGSIVDCSFENGQATAGAGIHMATYDTPPYAQLVVENSRFRHGETQLGLGAGGSGIHVYGPANGDTPLAVIVIGSEMFDNQRGHVWLGSGAKAHLIRCTLVNHDGFWPGLLFTDGQVELDNTLVWGPNLTEAGGDLADVTARYSNVLQPGPPLPGPGNLSADPLLVDDLTGDLRPTAGSPCIDAGDPAAAVAGVDVNGDPRLLDGDLDGLPRLDIGAREYSPVRLEVTGQLVSGQSLGFDSTGEPGLISFMTFGNYDEAVVVPAIGSYLINPFQAPYKVVSWPVTPSSVTVQLQPGLPTGGELTFVQVVFGASGVAASNAVTLEF